MSDEIQGLHNLVAVRGARHRKKRVGRGEGSGMGKTSGRGNKGQKARKSGGTRIGFEGGTLPLQRRLPKRGFSNYPFRVDFEVVNVGRLAERLESGATVDLEALRLHGLLATGSAKIKVLAEGDLAHALHVKAHRVSNRPAPRSKPPAAPWKNSFRPSPPSVANTRRSPNGLLLKPDWRFLRQPRSLGCQTAPQDFLFILSTHS